MYYMNAELRTSAASQQQPGNIGTAQTVADTSGLRGLRPRQAPKPPGARAYLSMSLIIRHDLGIILSRLAAVKVECEWAA